MKTMAIFGALATLTLATLAPVGSIFAADEAPGPAARALEMWRKRSCDTVATTRVFSKLSLKLAIANLGKLPRLEAWLASFEVAPNYTALEAWNDANVVSDAFPGFEDLYNHALEILDISREQGDDILAKCIAE